MVSSHRHPAQGPSIVPAPGVTAAVGGGSGPVGAFWAGLAVRFRMWWDRLQATPAPAFLFAGQRLAAPGAGPLDRGLRLEVGGCRLTDRRAGCVVASLTQKLGSAPGVSEAVSGPIVRSGNTPTLLRRDQPDKGEPNAARAARENLI